MDAPNRLYEINDMVKADCGDCKGCFSCCQGMGESILLDPYDIHLLKNNLKKSFEELLEREVELNISEGMILPNLKMQGKEEICGFLDAKRCSIHSFRPGLCRLFPLGRQYQDGKLFYFLLEDACEKENHSKVKVKKWLGVPEIRDYQQFLIKWHDFRKEFAETGINLEDGIAKSRNLFVLKQMYEKDFEIGRFYETFEERLLTVREG
ncbi:MAG: YkgJ family cysteine cluster protein [Roseburia sp.]|nr:YkgJ family cysteine cluster protein [Roseburia sp.]